MTGYDGKELANSFRTVRKNTIQVAEDIPESKYDHVAAPEVRPVKQMLAHIAVSTRMWQEIHKNNRTNMQGVDFLTMMDRLNAEEAKPRTKAEIVEMLRNDGEAFAVWLESLTPEELAQTVGDGEGKNGKARIEWLRGAKEHEMHHRAQLMLIERQLGIVPHLTRNSNEQLAKMRAAKGQSAGAA